MCVCCVSVCNHSKSFGFAVHVNSFIYLFFYFLSCAELQQLQREVEEVKQATELQERNFEQEKISMRIQL